MSIYYKEAILGLQETINGYPRISRQKILEFLTSRGCSTLSPLSDGTYIDLGKLDDDLIKDLYYYICKETETKPIEI